MFKRLINFLKSLLGGKNMKTLEKEKTNIGVKSDWEILCETCSSMAKKANWTEEDSDKILQEVRKELREQN